MLRQKILIVFCYLFIGFFIWVAIGQIIQLGLNENKLIKMTGTVERVESVAVREQKSFSASGDKRELRIILQEADGYFTIPYTFNYELLKNKIPEASKAEIYTRPSWLIPFVLGAGRQVMQLKVNGEMILSFQEVKSSYKKILIVILSAIPVFILLKIWLKGQLRKSRLRVAQK